MRIVLSEEQIKFIKETLKDTDKRSYDPVFKNLIERVVQSSIKEGGNQVNKVLLEEFEVHTIIESLRERSDNAQTSDSVKKECEKTLEFLEKTTGLSA